MLSDNERLVIVLSSIRDYTPGVSDISILIVEKIVAQIINCVDTEFTTQDVFNEITETYNYYNQFIKEKNIDMKPIPDGMVDLVEQYMNEVVENVIKNKKKK